MVLTLISTPRGLELRVNQQIMILDASTRQVAEPLLASTEIKLLAQPDEVLNGLARLGLACPNVIDMNIFTRDRGATCSGLTHDALIVDYGRLHRRPVVSRTMTVPYNTSRDTFLTTLTVVTATLAETGPLARSAMINVLINSAELFRQSAEWSRLLDAMIAIGLVVETDSVLALPV